MDGLTVHRQYHVPSLQPAAQLGRPAGDEQVDGQPTAAETDGRSAGPGRSALSHRPTYILRPRLGQL